MGEEEAKIFWGSVQSDGKVKKVEYPVWHEIFRAVYFSGLAIFCVLRELKVIFAIRTDWFLLLGINFGDFHKVLSTQH